YSSGMQMPSQPSRAIAWRKSNGNPPSLSLASQYLSSKRLQMPAIASRMASCSGLSEKSIFLYLGRVVGEGSGGGDHLVGGELVDILGRIADLGQYLFGVLAQPRRMPGRGRLGRGPFRWLAHPAHPAFARMVLGLEESGRDQMRILQDRFQIMHR